MTGVGLGCSAAVSLKDMAPTGRTNATPMVGTVPTVPRAPIPGVAKKEGSAQKEGFLTLKKRGFLGILAHAHRHAIRDAWSVRVRARVRIVTCMDAPVSPLPEVARALRALPIERFVETPEPHRIAVVTWSNRSHPRHRARNLAYCRAHGYACMLNSTRNLPRLQPTFEKLPLVRWVLETHDAVLQLDDDASIHRPHQAIQTYLNVFPTSAMIGSSFGWEVPMGPGKMAHTWKVDRTVHPRHPPGVRPATHSLQGGVILWRRSRYARTLLDLLLEDGGRRLAPYARQRCCFEQDALNAAIEESWMLHVSFLPMSVWNCLPGDRNTQGLCIHPFVLHIAGHKSKDAIQSSTEQMSRLVSNSRLL